MKAKTKPAVSCVSLLCLFALNMLLDGAAVTAANVDSQDGTMSTSLPKAVSVNTAVLDGYVGHYQLAPTAVLTVTREGDQLFAQLTGQPKVEIFPKSDTEFFYKVVDAQISFKREGDGPAVSIVLHQNGSRIAGALVTAGP